MKMLSSWFRVNRSAWSGDFVDRDALRVPRAGYFGATCDDAAEFYPELGDGLTCPANTIFSASFTQSQPASPAVVQQWKDFIQSLTPAGYDTVTINGTFDSVGRTLNDATVVPQIAAAMQNGTPVPGTRAVSPGTWE